MSDSYAIQICAEAQDPPWPDLVPLLESLLPVRFTFSGRCRAPAEGQTLLESLGENPRNGQLSRYARLVLPQGDAGRSVGLKEIDVTFAEHADVPFPFRSRSVRTKVASEPMTLIPTPGEAVLARSNAGPVWTVTTGPSGEKWFRSALNAPVLPPEGNLRDILNGDRFLEMLPLLHWLRGVCAATAYDPPSLRACFIFDDPNLHWPRYGFVDFRQLASHAAKENYHVSFATIPLDTWFTHSATAGLFRANASRLSLLVHGNDHTRLELARSYTEVERMSLLRQALARVERLERVAGVRVSRVMAAPHGACSEEMLSALPACGFEAACISHGSLRAHNRIRTWTRTLGFRPAEIIGDCPILPRWGVVGDTANTILLAAFLNQALILVGHHRDLKQGVGVLERPARLINSLGQVRWSDMATLSRLNYLWRMDGSTFRLMPLGWKLAVQAPKSATALKIDHSAAVSWDHWRIWGLGKTPLSIRTGESLALPEAFDGTISLEVSGPVPAPDGAGFSRFSIAPFCRRLLTESRDRLLSFCG